MDANNCKMACSIISKYQPLLYLSTVDSMNKCHAPQFFDVRRSIHTHRFIFLFWSRHQTSPALKLSSSRLLVTRPCFVSGMTQLVRHRHTPQLCDHLCRLELVAGCLVTVTNCAQEMDAELSNLGTITSNSVWLKSVRHPSTHAMCKAKPTCGNCKLHSFSLCILHSISSRASVIGEPQGFKMPSHAGCWLRGECEATELTEHLTKIINASVQKMEPAEPWESSRVIIIASPQCCLATVGN